MYSKDVNTWYFLRGVLIQITKSKRIETDFRKLFASRCVSRQFKLQRDATKLLNAHRRSEIFLIGASNRVSYRILNEMYLKYSQLRLNAFGKRFQPQSDATSYKNALGCVSYKFQVRLDAFQMQSRLTEVMFLDRKRTQTRFY